MRHTSIAASKLNIQKLLQNPKGSDDLDDGDYIEPLGSIPGIELVYCGFADRNLTYQEMPSFYNFIP